jgi:hypothetical protein
MQDILDKMVGLPLSSMQRRAEAAKQPQVGTITCVPQWHLHAAVGCCYAPAVRTVPQATAHCAAVDMDDLTALGLATPNTLLKIALQRNELHGPTLDLPATDSKVRHC